jgi:hypothetical protein
LDVDLPSIIAVDDSAVGDAPPHAIPAIAVEGDTTPTVAPLDVDVPSADPVDVGEATPPTLPAEIAEDCSEFDELFGSRTSPTSVQPAANVVEVHEDLFKSGQSSVCAATER